MTSDDMDRVTKESVHVLIREFADRIDGGDRDPEHMAYLLVAHRLLCSLHRELP